MNELSICRALIQHVEAVAREHEAENVLSIIVQVGPLCGVVPELLERSFSAMQAGTVAEHAQLRIEPVPLRVLCNECGAETSALSTRLVCGDCGDWHVRVVSGDQLLLASVEVERGTVH